jgi:hypothetical protein
MKLLDCEFRLPLLLLLLLKTNYPFLLLFNAHNQWT